MLVRVQYTEIVTTLSKELITIKRLFDIKFIFF